MRTHRLRAAVLIAVLLGSVTLGATGSTAEGCERSPTPPIHQNPTTITCGVGI